MPALLKAKATSSVELSENKGVARSLRNSTPTAPTEAARFKKSSQLKLGAVMWFIAKSIMPLYLK